MTDREERDRVLGIPIWQHSKSGRWYADFRSVPGEAMKESLRTRDRVEAEQRLADRKQELEEQARRSAASGSGNPPLTDCCERFLKRRKKRVAAKTLANNKRALEHLCTYLQGRVSGRIRLSDVTAQRLEDFLDWRVETDGVKKSTANVDLWAVSKMLDRVRVWDDVDFNGPNPARVADALPEEKPERDYLEMGEAIRVLKVSQQMEEASESRCYPHLHALIATFLLTGGRRMEVFGLEREDVDLGHDEVRIQANDWRGLKNRHSRRRIPLWPQLRSVLAPYLQRREDDHTLLFPSRTGRTLNDLRSSLDTVEEQAELETHLTPKVFRHTYCATRIQTLDRGEPVSLYTVARELGHKGVSRIEDTYGHLQKRRARLAEVRYAEADVIEMDEHRKRRETA